jgi:hypothetical protein
MNRMLRDVLEAAEAHRSMQAWTGELNYCLDAELRALMLQQINEPDR